MSDRMTREVAAPLLWNRPRLRFIEGAPETPAPPAEPAPAKGAEKPAQVPTPEPSSLTDEVEKWKALSRKNEQRAKENEAAAKRLAEIEEANKSELEKAQARAEAAEKKAAEAEAARLRTNVAAAKGVPADLLTGSTQEELEASADALLAFKGTTPTPAAPPATPQGQVGEVVNASGPDLDAAIAAAEKARNFPLAITLKQQKAAKKG